MGGADAKVAELAERQHGVFTRPQALAAGLTRRQIETRLLSGRWKGLYRGVYSVRGARRTREGTAMAAVLASGPKACVSHHTAGWLWTLDGPRWELHVTIPRARRVRLPGTTVYRPRNWSRSDATTLGPIPITSPARTLIDLASVLPRSDLEDAVDSAVRRDLVAAESLLRRLRRSHANGRVGFRALTTLMEERCARPVSGSALENQLGRILRAAGLPTPARQHVVPDSGGRSVARLDFAYPHAMLAIEVDGYAFHSARKSWEHDRSRQNRLVELGWVPLRITAQQIRERPSETAALVAAALARGGFGGGETPLGWSTAPKPR